MLDVVEAHCSDVGSSISEPEFPTVHTPKFRVFNFSGFQFFGFSIFRVFNFSGTLPPETLGKEEKFHFSGFEKKMATGQSPPPRPPETKNKKFTRNA